MKTKKGKITVALRRLWLYSGERAEALKRADYSCEECGVKQSKAKGREQKIQVHHIEGIKVWNEIADMIYKHILVNPDKLKVLCPDCHKETHD